MSKNMCPLCGGELTQSEQMWFCRATQLSSGGHGGIEYSGCGARGHYDTDSPIAREPDSVRLGKMRGRLLDAMTATSDRDWVERLSASLISLQMWEAKGWFPCDAEALWCEDYEWFEEDMKLAEDALEDQAKLDYSQR